MGRLRYSTRHKLWGRSQLVVTLRGIISELDKALKALDSMRPGEEYKTAELQAHIRAAIARCHDATVGMDVYKVERKRIKTALEREQKHLAAIMDLAKAIPITQEEKAVVKLQKRARAK